MSPNKKIPDRWANYIALGKRIPGTRFIAFKVPLKQALSRHVDPSEVFGPFELQCMLKEQGLELGLIIDLTYTTRYYKPQDLPATFHYLKIFTAGHDVPNNATILSFKKAVTGFLRDNRDNDKLIGVHCTHGLNRTGYLVCRYLIDVDDVEPYEAIDLFNSSRGHSIERQNYLQDLKSGPKRSNEGMDEPDQEPIQGGVNQEPSSGRTYSLNTNPTFSSRGPTQHKQNRPFQPRSVNHQFGPRGLLGPHPGLQRHTPGLLRPPGLLPLPQAPWPRRSVNGRFQDGYSIPPPYPTFFPQYRWRGGASAFPPGEQEVPSGQSQKSRHKHGRTRHKKKKKR